MLGKYYSRLVATVPPRALGFADHSEATLSILAALVGLVLCLLAYQWPASYRLDLATANESTLHGFAAAEHNAGGGFRWTTGPASVLLPPLGSPATLQITAIGWRPNHIPPPVLHVSLDGQPVAAWQTGRDQATYTVTLPRRWRAPTGAQLSLVSDTFVPGPADRRTLGVVIRSVELVAPGAGSPPVIPPLAVLGLAALAPILLQRASYHLGLSRLTSLVGAVAVTLLLTVPAFADRGAWLIAAPFVLLGIAALAALTAIVPPFWAQLRPVLAGATAAVGHGRLPVWPPATVPAAQPAALAGRAALRAVVAVLAAGLVLLHLLSRLAPEETEAWQNYAWGLRYVHSFPLVLLLLLALPVVGLTVPAVNHRVWRWLSRIAAPAGARLRRVNPYVLILAGSMALFPVLWLFRATAGEYGDSPEIQRKITSEGAVWREREPLDFFLHARLYQNLHDVTGWDVRTIYALTSCLSGVLFYAVLTLLVALLVRHRRDQVLAVALIGSAGFVQLFFGYLESYTRVTLGLAIYLWLGLLCLSGRVGIGWPATALGIAALFHPIALSAGPSLLIPFLSRWRQHGCRIPVALSLMAQAAAGLLIPLLLMIALFVANGYTLERWRIAQNQFGGGDMRTFKPLLVASGGREYYPILSLDHLLAVVNQQLLVAPAGWLLVLLLLLLRRPRFLWHDVRWLFLLLAAVSTTFFIVMWNPDLGARNDWDLLSFSALPTVTLATYLLFRLVRAGADRRYAALLLIAANVFHTGLWIARNSELLRPWL